MAELRRFRARDPGRSVGATIAGLARDEPQHPPLYYALARLWGGLYGDAGVAQAGLWLRWLGVGFGVLSLVAMAWLARELFEDRGARAIAVALFAVSPLFVLYAKEAREYALFAGLVAASSAALLVARRASSGRAWAGYALLTAAGLYTSFNMVTVIAAHGAFVLARERRPSRELGAFSLALGGAALLFAPWAWRLVARYGAFEASMAWSRDIVVPRAELLEVFALNLSRPLLDTGADGIDGAGVALAVSIALVALGGGLVSLRRAPRESTALIVALLVVPAAALLVPDLIGGGIRSMSARYLVPCHVAVVLAAAHGLGASRGPWPRARSLAAVAVVVFGLASAIAISRAKTPWTKGVSRSLPEVARALDAGPPPLLVANRERHHPGNVLALTSMVRDRTRLQLLGTVEDYALADHDGAVYLFSPSPRFVDELEASAGVAVVPVVRDLHLSLYRVEP